MNKKEQLTISVDCSFFYLEFKTKALFIKDMVALLLDHRSVTQNNFID
ncbi:hypothetical protein [Shewanella xiamenensis]